MTAQEIESLKVGTIVVFKTKRELISEFGTFDNSGRFEDICIRTGLNESMEEYTDELAVITGVRLDTNEEDYALLDLLFFEASPTTMIHRNRHIFNTDMVKIHHKKDKLSEFDKFDKWDTLKEVL